MNLSREEKPGCRGLVNFLVAFSTRLEIVDRPKMWHR